MAIGDASTNFKILEILLLELKRDFCSEISPCVVAFKLSKLKISFYFISSGRPEAENMISSEKKLNPLMPGGDKRACILKQTCG